MERESFAENWVGGLVWDGGGDGWQGVEWMRCLKVERMRKYGRDCGVLDVFACVSVQAGFSARAAWDLALPMLSLES